LTQKLNVQYLDEAGIETFRRNFRETFAGDPQNTVVYPEISKGIAPAGSEYYLPLFFQQTTTFFDYLPDNSILVFTEGAQSQLDQFQKESQQRFDSLSSDMEWPLLDTNAVFVKADETRRLLKSFQLIELLDLNLKNQSHIQPFDCATPSQFQIQPKTDAPYQPFIDYLNGKNVVSSQIKPAHTLLAVESAGRREAMLELALSLLKSIMASNCLALILKSSLNHNSTVIVFFKGDDVLPKIVIPMPSFAHLLN